MTDTPNESTTPTPTTRFQYVVTVNMDGSVLIDPSIPEDKAEETLREATAIDIIDASRKLVSDLERQIMLDTSNEMLSRLISQITPAPQPTVSDKVKEALNERGIAPEAQ